MFTVVIPIFNHARFLPDAVNSVLQDSLASEIILVDDGSSDDSALVAEDLARQYPQLVRLLPNPRKENKGAHYRLNQMVGAARLPFIAVLNSDDYFVPGKLAAMKSTLDETGCDVVIGSLVIINETGEHIGVKLPHLHYEYAPPPSLVNGHLYKSDLLKQAIMSQNIAATTSNYVFRKSFWAERAKFKDYRYAHDWEFLLQAVNFGRVQYNASAMTAYRMHSSNTISENRSKIVDELWCVVKQFASDLSLSESEAVRLFRYNRNLTPDVIASDAEGNVTYRCAKQFGSYSDERYDAFCIGDYNAKSLYIENNVMLNLMLFSVDFVAVNYGPQIGRLLGFRPNHPYLYVRKDIKLNEVAARERAKNLSGIVVNLSTAAPVKHLESKALENLILRADDCKNSLVAYRRRPNGAMKTGLIRPDGDKPIVLALPGFLAVGGVERVLESVMRELMSDYQFVVVNMEKLPEEVGSSIDRISEHAECIYELAHLKDASLLKEALSIIRDRYKPQCLWICNGCMMHMRHMHLIREVFKDAIIVDQQCYDSKEGWIAHFGQPNLLDADLYVACNKKIKDELHETYGIARERLRLIHPPFESGFIADENALRLKAKAFLAERCIEGSCVVLGVVARVSEQKQPLLYVQVMKILQDMQLPVHLIYVGDGPMMGETRKAIDDLGLHNMTMTGFMDMPHFAYYAMDGYLILSKYEGLPVSMLEALAVGLPVLSTDVGDISDVLNEVGGGDILAATDAESIARQIVQFLSTIESRTESIRTNRQKVIDRFSASRTASAYGALFNWVN